MKAGTKIEFYTVRKNNAGQEVVRHYNGIMLQYSEFESFVKPNDKPKGIMVPTRQIKALR